MRSGVLAACVLGLGCATARAPAPPVPAAAPLVSTAEAPAALPFLHDDYAAALEQARARQLPLFVEVWAPW